MPFVYYHCLWSIADAYAGWHGDCLSLATYRYYCTIVGR